MNFGANVPISNSAAILLPGTTMQSEGVTDQRSQSVGLFPQLDQEIIKDHGIAKTVRASNDHVSVSMPRALPSLLAAYCSETRRTAWHGWKRVAARMCGRIVVIFTARIGTLRRPSYVRLQRRGVENRVIEALVGNRRQERNPD